MFGLFFIFIYLFIYFYNSFVPFGKFGLLPPGEARRQQSSATHFSACVYIHVSNPPAFGLLFSKDGIGIFIVHT